MLKKVWQKLRSNIKLEKLSMKKDTEKQWVFGQKLLKK